MLSYSFFYIIRYLESIKYLLQVWEAFLFRFLGRSGQVGSRYDSILWFDLPLMMLSRNEYLFLGLYIFYRCYL